MLSVFFSFLSLNLIQRKYIYKLINIVNYLKTKKKYNIVKRVLININFEKKKYKFKSVNFTFFIFIYLYLCTYYIYMYVYKTLVLIPRVIKINFNYIYPIRKNIIINWQYPRYYTINYILYYYLHNGLFMLCILPGGAVYIYTFLRIFFFSFINNNINYLLLNQTHFSIAVIDKKKSATYTKHIFNFFKQLNLIILLYLYTNNNKKMYLTLYK